jgi:transposase-like protein
MGKVLVKEWENEPAELIEGLHEAIIDENTFLKVQSIFEGRSNQPVKKNKYDPNLPLRGHLICPSCGKNMTGSKSTGRNGGKHYYYHCGHCGGVRVRADNSNDSFIEYLRTYKVKEEILVLYREVLTDVFRNGTEDVDKNTRTFRDTISKLEQRKETILERFIDNELDQGQKDNLIQKCDRGILEAQEKLTQLRLVDRRFTDYISSGLPILARLDEAYREMSIEIKHRLIGSIFPGKLKYDGGKYRTARVNEVLSLIFNNSEAFQVQKE